MTNPWDVREPFAVRLRPRYEGANIRVWVGFKHFMYLVEEAVLEWFRSHDTGPQRLYEESGLGLEIVDCSVQLPAVLEVDDSVTAEVTPTAAGRLAVVLRADRAGAPVVARAKVAVALVREKDAPADQGPPAHLAGLVVPEIASETADDAAPDVLRDDGPFVWSWVARYTHCHFSHRVQHSAYVRAVEEVVDRYLAHRGMSVRRMLTERGWIPVVSRVRVTMLADVHMEETVHTTFVVDDVLKDVTYDARADSYVTRGGRLVHVATARILHGYAVARGPEAGRLAVLDAETVAALTGGR